MAPREDDETFERSSRIALLNKTNWATWSFKFVSRIENEGLDVLLKPQYVVPAQFTPVATGSTSVPIESVAYTVYAKKDSKLRRRITEAVEDAQIQYIRNAKTGAEMWASLKAVYEKLGVHEILLAEAAINTLTYGGVNSGSLQDHIDVFSGHRDLLSRAGAPMKDTTFQLQFLRSLPDSFRAIRQTVNLLPPSLALSFEQICQAVLAEEAAQREELAKQNSEKNSKEQALKAARAEYALMHKGHDGEKSKPHSYTKGSGSGRSGSGSGKETRSCYACGKPGHLARDCKAPKEETRDNRRQHAKAAKAKYDALMKDLGDDFNDESGAVLLTREQIRAVQEPDTLIIDSACTHHMHGSRTVFESYRELSRHIPISLGDDSLIYGVGRGTVKTQILNRNGGTQTVTFTDVLHVPSISGNLISLSQLTRLPEISVAFADATCVIRRGTKSVIEATQRGGLYIVDLASKGAALKANATSGNSHQLRWCEVWRWVSREMIRPVRRVFLGSQRGNLSRRKGDNEGLMF